MPRPFIVEDARGTRRLTQEDFPLALGGPEAEIELPGLVESPGGDAPAAEPFAWLGLSEGDLFVQPVDRVPGGGDAANVRIACNGTPLTASQWLHDGDVLTATSATASASVEIARTSEGIRLVARTRTVPPKQPPVLNPPPRAGEGRSSVVGPLIRPVEFEPRRLGGGARRRAIRPAALVSSLLLLGLLAVVGFLFAARSVRVEVEPAPDRLTFRGTGVTTRLTPALGGRRLLLPGTYALHAEKEGFLPLDETVEVGAEPNQTFTFQMEPLPEPQPEPPVAESEPVPPPEPEEPEPEPVQETAQAPPPPPPPSAGTLSLDSEPSGATVTVDGTYRGITPLDLELAPGEPHTVAVSRAGHDTVTETIELEAGARRELRVDLPVQTGQVRIAASPPDAELWIDGERRGEARQTLDLPAVPHRIEIKKSGYKPHAVTVTPLPGVEQSVEVTLPTVEAARAAAIPRTLTSSEGHELIRVEGGRFQMGTSRREPGRRANEALREVEITRPFYLAAREVSNDQFRRFQSVHLSGGVGAENLEMDDHPVVRVAWEQAAAYCNWLSEQEGLKPAYAGAAGGTLVPIDPPTNGYRLPTEAEWAWVARYPQGKGSPGEEPLKYPWGDSLPVPAGSGNYADRSAQGLLPGVIAGYDDGFVATAPADAYGPDTRGFYNLGGNVAEWVQDVYAIRPPGTGGIERDPRGPASGELHVIRGSSWMHGSITELRLSFRDYSAEERPDVGFRVARYLE